MYKASAYECLKATAHTSLKTFAPSHSRIFPENPAAAKTKSHSDISLCNGHASPGDLQNIHKYNSLLDNPISHRTMRRVGAESIIHQFPHGTRAAPLLTHTESGTFLDGPVLTPRIIKCQVFRELSRLAVEYDRLEAGCAHRFNLRRRAQSASKLTSPRTGRNFDAPTTNRPQLQRMPAAVSGR